MEVEAVNWWRSSPVGAVTWWRSSPVGGEGRGGGGHLVEALTWWRWRWSPGGGAHFSDARTKLVSGIIWTLHSFSCETSRFVGELSLMGLVT